MKDSDKRKPDAVDLSKDFDKVYLMYFSRMFRFAKRYVFSAEDAENIVQDIFAMLWEKRNTLHIRKHLDVYLFSLVKNRCIDYLRHRTVEEEYRQEYALKRLALERLNDSYRSEKEVERVIWNAIRKLPERCREIFVKSRVEGKKYREIAAELDLSISTVETQMHVALKKLRFELKDFFPLLLLIFYC